MSMSSTESLIQRKHKQPQHQNMTKVGHRKHHRKHFVKDVEAVVSLDDISVRDVEQENEDEDAKQRPEDWDDDDGRWGSPPTVGKPTIVNCKILVAQLQDLDTVRGTLNVRIGVWCHWTDPRLKGRSRMDPLPTELWSPRVTIDQSLGDFVRRTCELTICIGSLQGAIYNLTWYEGTIKNNQDLHIFPLDTDTVIINFRASECYKKNGEVNVNYKTDYRLLFEGWFGESGPTVAPYGWQLVSTIVEPVGKDDCQDIIQIKLNMKRQISFYFFKVVVPLILITCLNFMGFHLDTIGERLANNVSLFLSALALLYVVGQDLPHTTFLTAIDRIVLITLMLIFVTSIHFVVLWRFETMDRLAEEIDDLKNIENSSNTNLQISRVQAKIDKVDSERFIVLTYLSIYFAYLIIESLQLMIRRLRSCSRFKKNISHKKEFMDGIWKMENVWLNGVSEFNVAVKADTSYNIPAWLIMDPYDIALVKQGDSRALLLPALEVNVPTKLILPSGKAVVMSSKPAFKYCGKDVKWMTIGSPTRALEVILGTDKCIKVYEKFILKFL